VAAHLDDGAHGAVRWRVRVVRAGAPGIHRKDRAGKPRADAYRPGHHASADPDADLVADSVAEGQPHPDGESHPSEPVTQRDANAYARDTDSGHHAGPDRAHAGNVIARASFHAPGSHAGPGVKLTR